MVTAIDVDRHWCWIGLANGSDIFGYSQFEVCLALKRAERQKLISPECRRRCEEAIEGKLTPIPYNAGIKDLVHIADEIFGPAWNYDSQVN
ncbi:MAG: hypothetical protein WDZ85_01645 [Candidatus Paceibacterota bacterium]